MRRIISLLLLLLTLLAGCSPQGGNRAPQDDGEASSLDGVALISASPTPTPAIEWEVTPQRDYQPTTETARQLRAVLYFPHEARVRLISETRDIVVSPGYTYAQAVVQALLGAPQRPDLTRAVPEGTRLLSLEWTGELVTVNLSGEALRLSEEDRLLMRQALTRTLTELAGITYVSVLVENRAFGCYYLPVGPFTRSSESIAAQQFTREGEIERAHSSVSGVGSVITRDVVLYFADSRGQMLLPEVRRVDFSGGNYLDQLVLELMRGPTDTKTMTRATPASRFATADTLMVGDRMSLRVSFSNEMTAFLARKGLPSSLAYGAVLLTMLSFYPDVDDIEISVGGRQITSIPDINEGGQPFARGLFAHLIARPVPLYFPTKDGLSLVEVTRAVRHDEAAQPFKLLDELRAGPSAMEDALAVSPFPEQLSGEISVVIQDNRAFVILSDEAAESCAAMDAVQERNFVYSIVNTLCGMAGVQRVQFMRSGAALTTLAGSIDLSGPLLKNPGLVRR